nr:hypothetical protein CFP56_21937 [Quercus suber]
MHTHPSDKYSFAAHDSPQPSRRLTWDPSIISARRSPNSECASDEDGRSRVVSLVHDLDAPTSGGYRRGVNCGRSSKVHNVAPRRWTTRDVQARSGRHLGRSMTSRHRLGSGCRLPHSDIQGPLCSSELQFRPGERRGRLGICCRPEIRFCLRTSPHRRVEGLAAILSRVYQHLSPGGMYELYEGIVTLRTDDGKTSAGSAWMRWYDELRQSVTSRGVNPDSPGDFTGLLRHCGFTVSYDRWIKVYIDPGVAKSTPALRNRVNRAQVANQLSHDMRCIIINMTEKVISSPMQRALAAEA